MAQKLTKTWIPLLIALIFYNCHYQTQELLLQCSTRVTNQLNKKMLFKSLIITSLLIEVQAPKESYKRIKMIMKSKTYLTSSRNKLKKYPNQVEIPVNYQPLLHKILMLKLLSITKRIFAKQLKHSLLTLIFLPLKLSRAQSIIIVVYHNKNKQEKHVLQIILFKNNPQNKYAKTNNKSQK